MQYPYPYSPYYYPPYPCYPPPPIEEEPAQNIKTQGFQYSTGDFYPHLPIKKPRGRPKGTKSKEEKVKEEPENKGHWNIEENEVYHNFLQIHSIHFINKRLRRMDKIFKTMSVFLGTRIPQQCRSHHQKMEKKYHTFPNLIKCLRLDRFNSVDPEHIKKELEAKGYKKYDPLMTEEVIKQRQQKIMEELKKKRNSSQFVKEEISESSEQIQDEVKLDLPFDVSD